VEQGCIWLFDCRFKVLWLRAWPLAYRLYAWSVCETIVPLQLQLPLVSLKICYAFLRLPVSLA